MFGREATVAFEGDRIVERSPNGEETVWGEVLDFEVAGRVRFTWHPGRPGDRGTAPRLRVDQSMAVRVGRGLGPVGAAGLAQDAADVVRRGVLALADRRRFALDGNHCGVLQHLA